MRELELAPPEAGDYRHNFFGKGHKYCLPPLESPSPLIVLVSVPSLEQVIQSRLSSFAGSSLIDVLVYFFAADMAGELSSDPPAVATPVQTPWIRQFLRKARGQIDRPPRVNITPITRHKSIPDQPVSKETDIGVALSESGSDYSSKVTAPQKQHRGEAYAEGGLTKFYEPIPEYEGRHRWDPTAEWSPAEEKKLVRTVKFPHP